MTAWEEMYEVVVIKPLHHSGDFFLLAFKKPSMHTVGKFSSKQKAQALVLVWLDPHFSRSKHHPLEGFWLFCVRVCSVRP